MICPTCGKTLEPFELNGIEFDFCANGCHGIWLDHGELAEYISEHQDNMPTSLKDIKSGKLTEKENPKRPGVKLYEHHFLEDGDIAIDICPETLGIWCDFKELGKLKSLATESGLGGKLHVTAKNLEAKGYKVF
jgi:Zn-finger nucleic acid-binding protein